MKYICLDVETTGVTSEDKIVEIGWCEMTVEEEGVGILPGSEFSSLINPQRPISPSASGVNGVRAEDWVDSPLITDIAFPEGEVCLVGHNIKFDKRFVEPYINIKETICTLIAGRRTYPESTDYKLQTICALLNLPRRIAHRALEDVYSTVMLLDAIMMKKKMNLEEIIAWVKEPHIYEMMPFGKHKGSNISDLPNSYLKWLCNIDLDIDMRATIVNHFAKGR